MFNFKSLKSDFTLTRNNILVFKPDTTLHTAFTLAEVLITLGIIGVVAAMTMPTLINNAKNKELHSGLMKAYSVMQTVVQNIHVEEGLLLTNIQGTSSGAYKTKFIKFFNVADDCGTLNCYSRTEGLPRIYKTYTNSTINGHYFDDGQFLTQDGMFFMIENPSTIAGDYILLSVDVNGPLKNPNRWGFDVFTFEIMSDGKLMPSGAEGTTFSNTSTYCSKTSTGQYNGIGCTYKALYDKNYWKNLP